MEKTFFVYPYTQNSYSATKLAEELGCKKILLSGSSYSYKPEHILINWGNGNCPFPQALNAKIIDVINKIKFFDRLAGTGLTPAYAKTKEAAKALGYPIFCRTSIEERDGRGIVVADCDGQLVNAPLYTKGIDKTSEYRVHIGRLPDGIVLILGGSRKNKKPVEASMTNVPSDARIWCGDTIVFGDFQYENTFPEGVITTVKAAFDKFPELTFAAFDVVYDNSEEKAYVIEANSAPMATPQTTKAYGDFFRRYAATPTKPAITFESVLDDLHHEKITLKSIIEGFIQSRNN